jgi:diaminopimelate epimerase
MSRSIPFVKATACGNDFILIDGALAQNDERRSITQKICDRHWGVGADGVEWLYATEKADIYANLINSDGSHAEVSGNGTRCVAAWYVDQKKNNSNDIRILTDAGVKICTLVTQRGMEFEFRSDMGPTKIDGEIAIALSSGEQRGIQLSMGNPQFIVFVDEFRSQWHVEGAEIERHRQFPQRTNVEFVKVKGSDEIEIRIFERGAGETQSSGTGSCASAVAAIYTGRVKSPVRVVSPGGPQSVEWEGKNVFLTGRARILCRGEFLL